MKFGNFYSSKASLSVRKQNNRASFKLIYWESNGYAEAKQLYLINRRGSINKLVWCFLIFYLAIQGWSSRRNILRNALHKKLPREKYLKLNNFPTLFCSSILRKSWYQILQKFIKSTYTINSFKVDIFSEK